MEAKGRQIEALLKEMTGAMHERERKSGQKSGIKT